MTPKTLRSVDDLVTAALLPAAQRDRLEQVAAAHAIAVTPEVAETFRGDPSSDPVALQYLPSVAELDVAADEQDDPIGDDAHSPLPGLVHRYPDRVLIKATLVCPVYCRFCFRKTMVGTNAERPLTDEGLAAIFNYIGERPAIWEVILSGGDPLILSPAKLGRIVDGLERIAHVRILRIHSRVPVSAPSRIGRALLDVLQGSSKTVHVVLHANHAREFSPAAVAACARIVDAGIPMLGQSVLLKGVNDSVEALGALMRTFVENRVTPYYLHHLDAAPGTGHFRVGIEQGQALLRELRGRYSGLCQPDYVLDIPGGHGKSPIGPRYLHETDTAGAWRVQDFRGRSHAHPPAASGSDEGPGGAD